MTVSEALRAFIRTPFASVRMRRDGELNRGADEGDDVAPDSQWDFTHISYAELEAAGRRLHRSGLIDREQLEAMEQANVGWSYAAGGRRIRIRIGRDGRLAGDDERFDFAAHLAKEIKLIRAYGLAHEARFRRLSGLLAAISGKSDGSGLAATASSRVAA